MTEPRMPTITIRHRYTDVVLYEHETTQERIDSGLAMRNAYLAALTLIRVHAQQWPPAEQSATREAA